MTRKTKLIIKSALWAGSICLIILTGICYFPLEVEGLKRTTTSRAGR